MTVSLTPHPDSRQNAVKAVSADVRRTATGLALRYELTGDTSALAIPELSNPSRADELWKHTCFEVFVRKADGKGYLEFNLSPTGEWAAYGFDGYRDGMTNVTAVKSVPIGTRLADQAFALKAEIDLAGVKGLPEGDWTVAVTSVVEATDGSKSYWALAHPQGKPDFHAADGFVLNLPAPAN
ncbi:MAG: DOMON-like domain-containing protein [Novosphingobium sp.]|nr:DOMON-like domain-containing protein [Novosphingobium sp.]